ncbi:MAG: nicotinate (nicotinamide) nucleotide adenylyltransferase [Desulfomonile tiedjei]|uniref:Probable nicotinate-nucleotide adenylyltransferase n=1 Tax=Desulfomonile tiedjei TaxID=2358 RepID=A0A9D6V972_9BACT|nr:nicotinate (nicotinamide) nucleotide adenylyltransferase [Desulfomonile tiedjei]
MPKTSPFSENYNNSIIGILGGTFNPPHLGHLRLAEEVACVHGLSRVIFIPSLLPPHKGSREMAPSSHRLEMTRKACADNSLLEVSDLELRMDGPSYTVNTLRMLQGHDVKIHFIMGTDSLREISLWKDYDELFSLSNFIVVKRPGVDFRAAWTEVPEAVRKKFRQDGETLVHEEFTTILPSPVEGLNISSTRIRNLLKEGRSIRYLVPEEVRSYIVEHQLYGK